MTTAFTGDIPGHYHAGLGPLLFEPFAEELAARARQLAPRRVLETACGTGIVTRRLTEALRDAAEVVATDLSADMLEVARRTASAAGELRPADMTALPFPDGSFDLVVCQFGLMFAPDRPAAAREARRVLAPGGTWLLSTWGPLEHNEVTHLAHRALAELFPDDPPRFYETPFSMADAEALARLLRDAGFASVEVEVVRRRGAASSARAAATGLVLGNPIAGELTARGSGLLEEALRAVEHALAAHYGKGAFETEIEALVARAGT
jgi:ubiquinone/menaquinone biosynthesis C-methylase UbiE